MSKDIQRVRGKAALETIRESPAVLAVALVPVAAIFALIWWLTNLPLAIVALIAAGAVLVVKGKLLH